MRLTRRSFLTATAASVLGVAACATAQQQDEAEKVKEPESTEKESEPETEPEPDVDLDEFEALALDMAQWNYDEDNDCWYQLGLTYCIKPGSEQYESLAIFVPGPYLAGEKHGKTYECTLVPDAKVGAFTAATAPIVMPINSVLLRSQASPTSYSYEGLGRYLEAGLVYVYSGFRGRSGGYDSTNKYFATGAPWGVTDLKAAVRYLRYNAEKLPCDTSRVIIFGYGGGGGLSCVAAALGDSELYDPYLEEIGAATHDAEGAPLSDALFGSATWCPITSFDLADAAYEWMMGQYGTKGTRAKGTWTSLLSKDLAAAYAYDINDMGLESEGEKLSLDRIDDGTYTAGSYYDHIVSVLELAASNFLHSEQFPYAAVEQTMGDPGFPGDPDLKRVDAEQVSVVALDGTSQSGETTSDVPAGVTQVQTTVYDSHDSYIAALNGDGRWFTYNADTGHVRITGLWDFVQHCRMASRDVCAYDAIDRSTTINQLFGISGEKSSTSTLHFDTTVSGLLAQHQDTYGNAEDWDGEVVNEWAQDILETDDLEVSMSERVNMYNPLYELCQHYAGYGKAKVAPHWRINTGLFQSVTTFVGEMNLALALESHKDVSDVAFEALWGAGFELCERTGNPEDNFVAWVLSCCESESAKKS